MFSQRVEVRRTKGKFYPVIILILFLLLSPLALSHEVGIVPQHNQAKPQKKEEPKKFHLPIEAYLPRSFSEANSDQQAGKLDLSLDFLYDYSEFFEYNRYLIYYRMTRRVTLKSLNILFGGPARPFAGAPIWDGLFLPVYSLHRDPVLRTFWWDW